nr:hypothetical protein [Candidatus Sigynarchaeota archaeon]
MDKTVHLLSSGLDSPVAGYLLVKAGIEPTFLFFDASPGFNTRKTRDTAVKLARVIARHAGKPLTMYIAFHEPNIRAIQKAWGPDELKYTCVFCKRLYYRVAKAIADINDIPAISSGEIIGEQASQTIDNLAVIQESIGSFLVIRPLLTTDKVDVIAMAREIGTFDISSEARDPCLAVPRYPMTHGNIDRVKEIEAKVDIKALVEYMLARLEKITVTPLET